MGRPRILLTVSLLWLALCLIEGCGYHNVRLIVPKQNEQTPISFLKDGQTTKAEVMSRFGQKQTGTFEGGRILVFMLDKQYRIVTYDDKARFHLILVFDDRDRQVLKTHSLVQVR
jgi:hypothetical protein